ncbi:hypothetical protein BROUX41_003654 [Berkeleyomyces rouxiae]
MVNETLPTQDDKSDISNAEMPDKIIVKGIAIHPARLATSHTFFEDSKSSTTPEEMVRRIRTFEIPNISVAGFHAWSEEMCNAMIISRTSALFLEDPPKASTDHGLAAQHTWKKILRESCPDFNLPPGKNLNDSLKLIEHRIKTSTLPSAAKKFYEATNVSCASPSDLHKVYAKISQVADELCKALRSKGERF